MKKRIFAVAVILICLSILASTSFAYFTTTDTARNVITTAGVDVNILEQQLVDNTLQTYTDPIDVLPATTVSKIVSVQNLEQPAWVRMNYEITVYDANKKAMDIPADELAKVILIEEDTEHWIEKDGWWYYKQPLEADMTTVPLFDEVAFSGPHMDNKYQNCTIIIDVFAHAVQKVHNKDNVLEAAGWPEKK